MHRVLERFFVSQNCEEVEVNIDEIKVYIKDNIIYSIIDFNNNMLTCNQFNNIMSQLYSGILDARSTLNKSIIFACGKDVDYIVKVYMEYTNKYNIEESKVVVDMANNRIMQDQLAFEECASTCRDISDFINSWVIENSKEQKNNTLETKIVIKEFLKKSCVHIAIVNILIYIVLMFVNNKTYEDVMMKFSINWKYIMNNGQWYRIISSMFLHWDTNHLVNNMITLCAVGTYLEKMIGRKWIIISYFVTGILAGLTSIGYNMKLEQEVYAAGASGAIFGLIGILLAVLVMSKGRGDKISGRRLLIYVILVVWSQISDTQVDNAAHIGGILAGIITGMVYTLSRCKEKKYED